MKINMDKGYIQIYTGNGKGKTTCAVGQGIRACGCGFKVLMVQFLKSWNTGEIDIIKNIDKFDFMRIGSPRDFTWNLTDREKSELKCEITTNFKFLSDLITSKKYDMIILDEILGTINEGFLSEDEVIDCISKKPNNVEIIITGRNASKRIIEKAELVTEMKEIKHYFKKGVEARRGIEF